jgi:hypothetical protein
MSEGFIGTATFVPMVFTSETEPEIFCATLVGASAQVASPNVAAQANRSLCIASSTSRDCRVEAIPERCRGRCRDFIIDAAVFGITCLLG